MGIHKIVGRSPKEIKDLYALPVEPTHISNVNLPKDANMRVGFSGKNEFSPDGGGGLQYEILSDIKREWYSDTKLIEGSIRD